jgi:inner membrane protein
VRAAVGYVGLQFALKERALAFGERFAHAAGLRDAVVQAQPRPVSPFNWTVFVSDERAHRFAHVNLVRRRVLESAPDDGFVARLDAAYRPLADAHWLERPRFGPQPLAPLARDAWQSPALGFFRWFADLPAFDGVTQGSECVWFVDLRFLTPGRESMPFGFGACRADPGGAWRAYQRRDDGSVVPL